MFNIHQNIYVGTIRIESLSNSSMLQIGTSGGVNATSYVSGESLPVSAPQGFQPEEYFSPTLVPLPNPT